MKQKVSSGYIPAFDGMRAFSILIVFIAHLGFERMVPGGLGVTIFFFISGFLITRLLLDEFTKDQTIHLKGFYIRRLLRLYPPLFLQIIVVLVFVAITNQVINKTELLAAFFYFENYYFVFFKISEKLMTHFDILWSLAVEEHFYLVFPFLFLLFVRKKNILVSVLLMCCFICLIVRYSVASHFDANYFAQQYNYQLSHTRADSIFYGCLLSVLLSTNARATYLKYAGNLIVFAIAAVVLLFTIVYRDEFFRQTIRYSLQGVSFMVLLPAILYEDRYQALNRFLSLPILILIGRLSYSIYLFHWVALKVSEYYQLQHTVWWYISNILLTTVLALSSYYGIEKPVFGLRKKFGSKVKA